MNRVMMQLGSYQFGIETSAYEQLRRSTAYRWQGQDRIGRRPAQQFAGVGQETITLTGRIYPFYRGGLGQLDKMRAEAGQGEPRILVDGLGRIWGKWAVTRIDETQSVLMPDGVPEKIDFTLELAHYGEDTA
ncbi:MAG: phage tail protein [Candidatus Thiodiazotropha sp. (ex Dulcina madagascariensis)]|nr:phage tail protein [Candidatus Thiodiazotropha sp. (ex Dulcina madagascariensis)]